MNVNDQRRKFLQLGAAAGGALLLPRWAIAQTAFKPTEPQVEGPFYPPGLPRTPAIFSLDNNNDMIWVNGKTGFALGTFLELSGRVLDPSGRPLRNIEVQLWQCDNYGRYHHPGDTHIPQLDANFQGFGKAVTDGDGRYFFRTIKPAAYPGRTPHLHFKLKDRTTADLLTTQMYVAGDPSNASDGIYQGIPLDRRGTVTVPISAPRSITVGNVARKITSGRFNIVLGTTPRIV
jgi:protocatechuate 3,4-dioxygenase, beta subunit